ncbi:hypothetical protein LY76DRAFT_618075 [Colletotrichum caudatum]|nr:hypothetical protein LY76DRAFT_618075 [Colletotrichum caudatum]
MAQDMSLQGLRVHIRFSLPEEAPGNRWTVTCTNAADLALSCPGSLQIAPNPGSPSMGAINRSLVRLGIQGVRIKLQQGSEDKVILTGFGRYYKKYRQRGWAIPDLDSDMAELLSRFPFVVFLITRTVMLSSVLLYNPGSPEFPGVNFAKVVKSCTSQTVTMSNRKCIVIYTSEDSLVHPYKPISLYDLDILEQDPDFNFLRSFTRTYEFCVAASRNRGEDLPQLIYGHDDGWSDSEGHSSGGVNSDDESMDELTV